jgi:hypothetical protein
MVGRIDLDTRRTSLAGIGHFRGGFTVHGFGQRQSSQALTYALGAEQEVSMRQSSIKQGVSQNRYGTFLSQNLVKGHPSTYKSTGKMGDDLMVKGFFVFHPI